MPVNRTNPVIKPAKAARTHEENQERAYIAASRRSDRNLEARIESAKRASKIHKRRTGRPLRVTEQAVLKEKVYEEEEDDGHPQMRSPDFSGGLAAYPTTHVGLKTTLDQALPGTCTQTHQHPKQPQFVHYIPVQQQPSGYTTPLIACKMIHRAPPTYSQTPYPVPPPQGFRMQPYNSSVTFPNPEDMAQPVPADPTTSPFDACSVQKSMSMPPHGSPPISLVAPQPPPHSALSRKSTSLSRSPSTYTPTQVLSPPSNDGQTPVHAQQLSQQSFQETWHPYWPATVPTSQPYPFYGNYGPFPTTLPIDSQQWANDRLSSMLTANNGIATQRPYYSYNPNQSPMNARMFHPAFDGVSEPLAPSVIGSDFSKSNYMGPQ